MSATKLDRVQDYHLRKFEFLESEQDRLRQELYVARDLASGTSVPPSGSTVGNIGAMEHILERGERTIEHRKILLDWIEQ